jgi:hypothetical protein
MTPNRLLTMLYCLTLFVIISMKHREQRAYVTLMSGLLPSARLFGLWRMPRLSPRMFDAAGCFLLAMLALGVLEIFTQFALLLAIPAYFFYFGQIRTMSYIGRKSNLIPQFLFVIGLTHFASLFGHTYATTLWAILVLKMIVIQVYISGAYSKLRNSGFAWLQAQQFQGVLLHQDLLLDIPIARLLAGNTLFCTLIPPLILLHQLTFPLSLIATSVEPFYVVAALLFHIGTFVVMKINYLVYHAPCYIVFAVVPFTRYLMAHHYAWCHSL